MLNEIEDIYKYRIKLFVDVNIKDSPNSNMSHKLFDDSIISKSSFETIKESYFS